MSKRRDKSEICVKCGSRGGWIGPVYKMGTVFDRLEFTCERCGYRRSEPAKDVPDKRHRVDAVMRDRELRLPTAQPQPRPQGLWCRVVTWLCAHLQRGLK